MLGIPLNAIKLECALNLWAMAKILSLIGTSSYVALGWVVPLRCMRQKGFTT